MLHSKGGGGGGEEEVIAHSCSLPTLGEPSKEAAVYKPGRDSSPECSQPAPDLGLPGLQECEKQICVV